MKIINISKSYRFLLTHYPPPHPKKLLNTPITITVTAFLGISLKQYDVVFCGRRL